MLLNEYTVINCAVFKEHEFKFVQLVGYLLHNLLNKHVMCY